MAAGSERPGDLAAALMAGRGVILLAKEDAWSGHFFALAPRLNGTQIEVYDPLGGGGGVALKYLRGSPGDDLNGEPAHWLGDLLDAMRAEGYSIGYNLTGPQREDSSTCLLHCFARIGAAELVPSEYSRRARHIFS